MTRDGVGEMPCEVRPKIDIGVPKKNSFRPPED